MRWLTVGLVAVVWLVVGAVPADATTIYAAGGTRAFSWDNGVMTDLDVLTNDHS